MQIISQGACALRRCLGDSPKYFIRNWGNLSLEIIFYLMLKPKIDPKKRSKTLQISNNQPPSLVSTPTNNRNKCPTQEQYLNHIKTQTSKQNPNISGCPFENDNPTSACESPEKGNFKKMKMMIRSELQKLTYRQKLNNIEAILWRCKELCQKYGYFILTCMMFEYNPHNDIKFGIWIHPDKRIQKPLHPITKPTQFECQLEFIGNLRRIFREMFPTIDLGKGKTFSNLAYHIADLKKSIILKGKKSFGPVLPEQQRDPALKEKYEAREPKNTLCTSLKAMPIMFHPFQNNTQICDDNKLEQKYEQKQNNFKINKTQKGTASTLVQSMRSNNSIKDKIRNATLCLKQQSDFPRNFPSFGPTSKTLLKKANSFNSRKNSFERPIIQEVVETIEEPHPHPQPQPKPQEKYIDRTKKSQIHSRRSRINAKMATSGEIQSDLNNLFGADEHGDVYYEGFGDGKHLRNSVLSQVMEEFQDLLF